MFKMNVLKESLKSVEHLGHAFVAKRVGKKHLSSLPALQSSTTKQSCKRVVDGRANSKELLFGMDQDVRCGNFSM